MDFLTMNLIINYLFILLPGFALQIWYIINYIYKITKVKYYYFSIIPIASLILCFFSPVVIEHSFIWDLRWIPFILGVLYFGKRFAILLLGIVIVTRYFVGVDDGFYIALIVFPIVTIIFSFFTSTFLTISFKQKVLISSSLTIIGIFITYLVTEFIIGLHFSNNIWIQYSLIQVFFMAASTLFIETLRTNFIVLHKLIRAQKLEMVSHMAASVSHEVRNPLTVSRGFIQLLGEDVPHETKQEYIKIAIQELDKANEVIEEYLTFAKPTQESSSQINISEDVLHSIKIITPLANMNQVEIVYTNETREPVYVKGDQRKFQQSLMNFMKNGIEAMGDIGGFLQITINDMKKHVIIKICDSGHGLTPAQIQRLGEPYFTTKKEGTGLGLMITYSMIKEMQGEIKVESEVNIGTCFIITLPID